MGMPSRSQCFTLLWESAWSQVILSCLDHSTWPLLICWFLQAPNCMSWKYVKSQQLLLYSSLESLSLISGSIRVCEALELVSDGVSVGASSGSVFGVSSSDFLLLLPPLDPSLLLSDSSFSLLKQSLCKS